MNRSIKAALFLIALAGCSQERAPSDKPDRASADTAQAEGDANDPAAFSRISPEETVHFTGTEPFWGGQVSFTNLTYSTPENPDGTTIAVQRFAGRGGVSWSGKYEGAPFTLAVTPGKCSDGMSDQTYPYGVTLEVLGEQRSGCAWTDSEPRTPPPDYTG